MSLWSRLFGRFYAAHQANAAQDPLSEGLHRWNEATRALLGNESNRQFVRDALDRLEHAGLRVSSTLNREIIAVRILRDFANFFEGDDLAVAFANKQEALAKNSFDLLVFLHLAGETDAFYAFDDFDALKADLPSFRALDDDAIETILDDHSCPIFENADIITIVNEHDPGTFLEEKIRQLESLACSDFVIQSVVETTTANRLLGEVTLDDGSSETFEIEHSKRADLTPLFNAMNDLVAHLGKGAFTVVLTGTSEDLIAVYLRPAEQFQFDQWAKQQSYSDGSSPFFRLDSRSKRSLGSS
ncbi:hypothetical protein PQJ75_22915 [Rhodoplanes sp. TEM]|uniref:Uncharacterized protein n=1 Tax=Rhodoplanes tepidamans TaxID=200616 RepID=A0ABT5JC35_RHOTP|nr:MULTISPECIES: hypothetical protein [Rhodoplanes]MDC7787245.1 hypothetical protein [Rhodoplanes tepidamans]MDC7986590.1 hypothetical protein [Rhodoplanes sp. TEM]MDQ0357780.1 hypothetical protein [Rhodoplanes tepidamans]